VVAADRQELGDGAPGGEFVFTGDTITWRAKDGETRKNKDKLDPSQKPKAIETTPVRRDECYSS
jgi:hypothetical protein